MSTAVATEATTDEKKWKMIDARIRRRGNSPDALIEVLHAVQEAFGYLEPDVLEYVGNALGVPRAVSTAWLLSIRFSRSSLKVSTPLSSAPARPATSSRSCPPCPHARSPRHKTWRTSEGGKVSLLTARCLGACSMAPAMVVDGNVQGRVAPEGIDSSSRSCGHDRRCRAGANGTGAHRAH